MTSKWKTHRGDEWWYSDCLCDAEGWFSSSAPIHLEITLKDANDKLTNKTLYNFLLTTQNEFPECQLWLILNPYLKKLMTHLKQMKKLDWTIIKNPLSESARITYILINEHPDEQRKKYLKNLGKKIVDERSDKLKKMMKESNPASIDDPAWIINYKDISIREKYYQNNRKEIYPKEMAGDKFLLNQISMDLSNGYLPIQGYYLHCLTCGNLVPMNPEIDLKCHCESISLEPSKMNASLSPEKIEVVKLIAKANSKVTFMNRLLSKVKQVFRVQR